MKFITCSISYALQQPLEKEQLLFTALEWQKILEPMIAEEVLGEVLQLALTTHKTSFAVNMHDVIKTFNENPQFAVTPEDADLARRYEEAEKKYYASLARPTPIAEGAINGR